MDVIGDIFLFLYTCNHCCNAVGSSLLQVGLPLRVPRTSSESKYGNGSKPMVFTGNAHPFAHYIVHWATRELNHSVCCVTNTFSMTCATGRRWHTFASSSSCKTPECSSRRRTFRWGCNSYGRFKKDAFWMILERIFLNRNLMIIDY